ncbi:MAG TPA: serine/threonine-protein kinase PknK, partial [Edaphobacter sp.]|nr:serine/threonine-protein kinase PknK [Edaphobacter sp.]
MEHPGGEVLATLLGEAWELTQFLHVAIGIAVSLGRLQERGLVHKDIKPANLLVNKQTGEAWLTGFGIASRLMRERQDPGPPLIIAGTLPYMAPEQTGRMNRSIDSRSDLYSFGITLYEMLTGELPFTASDPMEWIHCHVARPPVPVSERVEGIPVAVSAIISKLMSKNAEDRYQTAAGIEQDLRRCLAEWESRGQVDSFSTAEHDASRRLFIPEKLYGRAAEVDRLVRAFELVVDSGAPGLILVSGYSGIGKTSLVNELHKALILPQGLFASGKADQFKRDMPYAALGQAFRGLVLRILSQSDIELTHWRALLQEAVGTNGQLIVNLIPEIELIIGKQPPIRDLQLRDSQNRFKMVFRRFLCAFARHDHPLVLFLDDLQWLDSATLELLESLLKDPDVRSFLLIGAYRSNEVGSAHPLRGMLEAIRKADVPVDEIVLTPLHADEIGTMIVETLHCRCEQAKPLAALVYEKTGGNPFFAMQFVSALAEEKLIVFDPKLTAWTWDLERIQTKGYTDNVADLMIGKLNRLPVTTREVLKKLACLETGAETITLAVVHEVSEDEIHSTLWEAVNVGLASRRDSSYAFLHDRIHEAAYALIPEGDRAAVHLGIGRLLTANTPSERREERIFEIVNQLNRGIALITSAEEREQVAGFNLVAGNCAKTGTAYAASLIHLLAGKALLPEDCWERCYPLAFAMDLSRAECEFLTGELTDAEERLSMLAARAATLHDRAAVTRLRVALYTTLDRSDCAVEVGLEYLRHVGIGWSPNPTDEEVQRECERMWQLLGNRPIEELIDLPLMTDPDWRTTMDVLVEIAPPARFIGGNLHHLLFLRMANLSLEHGNCDGSCYAYASLSIVLGDRFDNFQTGFSFGKLGVDLVDELGLDRFRARVYMCFGILMPWTKHSLSGQAWIRRGFETANAMGDLTHATYSAKNLITNLFVSGVPLGEVQQEAENGLAFSRKAQFGLIVDCFIGQLALIRSLRGLAPKFAFNNDDDGDEVGFEQHLAEKPHLSFPACGYWIHKLQALFFAGDYAAAVQAAIKARDLLWVMNGILETAEYHFYAALARAALASDTALADRHQEHIDALLHHYRKIVVWSDNCPETFANRAALVAAEIARLERRELDAMHLYEEAIRLAREQGFIQNEGLANELAARFCTGHGFETSAHAYLRSARQCYLRWGADGKVQQLDRLHSHLREELNVLGSTFMIGAQVEHLDLATVVRVSQAISGEIVLERLIQTLMSVVVEHAGAERAVLILPQCDEQRIEAEATTGREGITVRFVGRTLTSSDLPESALKYLLRTQETVILDDALAPNLFSADNYIVQKRVRS